MVSVAKYTGFKHTTDLKQLYDDIIKTAHIADVPYNRDIIWKVLYAYQVFFSGSTVAFRTTTRAKHKRGLNVRYIERGVAHDPYRIALSEGLIANQGHPIDDLMPEIQSLSPTLGYGLDFEVDYGVEKIWPFFPQQVPRPIKDVFSLSSLPDSVRNHADYFARHDLALVNILGLDYRHQSINVYFPMERSGTLRPRQVTAMIADLEFEVPTPEILKYCSMANAEVYFTFSWNSPRIERVCFAVDTYNVSLIPTHFDPLIKRYVAEAPFACNTRRFIFNITFARSGNYIKIENNYT